MGKEEQQLYNPAEYVLVRQAKSDPHFGDCKILQSKTSLDFFCEITRTFSSESELGKAVSESKIK